MANAILSGVQKKSGPTRVGHGYYLDEWENLWLLCLVIAVATVTHTQSIQTLLFIKQRREQQLVSVSTMQSIQRHSHQLIWCSLFDYIVLLFNSYSIQSTTKKARNACFHCKADSLKSCAIFWRIQTQSVQIQTKTYVKHGFSIFGSSPFLVAVKFFQFNFV